MTSCRNLAEQFDGPELPFPRIRKQPRNSEIGIGPPSRSFNSTPAHADRYESPAVDPLEKPIVHYGPGYKPLCGKDTNLARQTDDPYQVTGCQNCLDLVTDDLVDQNHYAGRCLHCLEKITATGGVEARRALWGPCPHCGRQGW